MESGEDDHPELENKEEAWGSVASNVSDPQKCIEECRAQVLASVVPGFNGSRYNEVCKHLLADDEDAKNALWELYCCDATECGVHLSGKPELGQDPSVNLVINVCQGIFAPVIKDPGPLPDDSVCPISLNGPFRDNSHGPAGSHAIDCIIYCIVGLKDVDTLNKFGNGIPDILHTTRESVSNPSTRRAICGNQSRHRHVLRNSIPRHHGLRVMPVPPPLTGRLRPQPKERDRASQPPARYIAQTPFEPPQRRLLSTHGSPERPSININVSIPGTPLGASGEKAGVFSPSPISTPTPTATNRVPPKYDRSTKPYYGVPPPPNTFGQGTGGGARSSGKTSSMSSAASGRTATTVSNVSSIFPQLTPYSWPMRPPRPHEKPLLIPDLVCPGPPPARSLPPAPPGSPESPVSFHQKLLLQQLQQKQQQQQKRGDGFDSVSAAVSNGWVPPRNPARGVVLEKESRDLCDLTETCARESRERSSWGSWSIGGGGTGVGASSVQKGAGSVNSPVLEEADLERIGGRY
ncbi:hypothetical protein CNYM01_09640 [Colletotrichum nymphaeae SA-01]|uniref:Uncharacterized protein n=1 Tax=Colletotrichum nymphaeae SA-01 TaxID=1460502 RepID=A0A135ULV5_9PEZI|nr:hypothetical protein CNYM01_09640 [Colletotrichum nymphaeae SA-01]